MSAKFDRFIGIDWSGANGRPRGLCAYECDPGSACPTPILHPMGWNWNRTEVRDYVVQSQAKVGKVLVGIDFAFAYPYCDMGSYFLANPQSPLSAIALWAMVEQICAAQNDFYADALYNGLNSPFAGHFCTQQGAGANYVPRLRVTETACQAQGVQPGSAFHCVGASVGCGSAAGMRFLHHFATVRARDFEIWPFTNNSQKGASVIVELYPSYLFHAANSARQFQNHALLNQVLSFYGSTPLSPGVIPASQDQADALICAAALRNLASDDAKWAPASMNICARTYEGWIFGV